jgi:hypothetical protein
MKGLCYLRFGKEGIESETMMFFPLIRPGVSRIQSNLPNIWPNDYMPLTRTHVLSDQPVCGFVQLIIFLETCPEQSPVLSRHLLVPMLTVVWPNRDPNHPY